MTTLEKLQLFKDRGFSLSYIAQETNVVPATLTRWVKGEKGISRKNERIIDLTLQKIAKELYNCASENNDGDL